MELVTPGVGLLFWMTLSFGLMLYVLGKMFWKPIVKAMKNREEAISQSLNEANKAREEMKALQINNEQLLLQAKEERDQILKEARKLKDELIEKSKIQANEEYNRIVESAKESIHYEKMAAITELKNQMATLSIEIAQKLIQEELQNSDKQKTIVDKMLKEINFN
ncbi:MAG: F0F1 ATP synthase subunit B [Lentimicrobiaceae bacterium]|nr:F0F1 ATP synthase subunit B [Lentimicrobiaceae bacterium]